MNSGKLIFILMFKLKCPTFSCFHFVDVIWKAYAFNIPKKSDFRTQEVNKVGKFEHFMVKVFKFCYFVVVT